MRRTAASGLSAVATHHVSLTATHTNTSLPFFNYFLRPSLVSHSACQHSDIASHGTVRAACIAAAGPVAVDRTSVAITNWPVVDQDIRLDALPASIFPRGMTRLGNDMEAGALGLVALEQSGKLSESFKALWKVGMDAFGVKNARERECV